VDQLVRKTVKDCAQVDNTTEDETPGLWPRPDMPPFELHSPTHMLLTQATQRLRVGVITGGPSAEAAVSLASARTVVDALQTRPHVAQAAGLSAALEQVQHL
jgi:hypothetical protein